MEAFERLFSSGRFRLDTAAKGGFSGSATAVLPGFLSDRVADPQDLGLRLSVNGVVRQNGSTADMVFSVAHVVWYLSQFMVLHPGDLVNTGTPAGVGAFHRPPRWIQPGEVLTSEIEGVGSIVTRFVAAGG